MRVLRIQDTITVLATISTDGWPIRADTISQNTCAYLCYPRGPPSCNPELHIYHLSPETGSNYAGAIYHLQYSKVGRLYLVVSDSCQWLIVR
jgi:hypothetical protein